MTGKLYGIGVGPGDPDLITVKAQRILAHVPVIAWPAPLEGPSLARTIAAPHIAGARHEIAIRMPMVAERFPAQQVYDRAADKISCCLRDGKDVAVLCEGDPFFYGSFLYLFARLAKEHRVEVVPGVSSLTASAASLGAPLATRNDILTIIPAPLSETEITDAISGSSAFAIIKIGRHLDKVRKILDALNLTLHARYIEHATMDSQIVIDLADVDSDKAPYFSMILVHKRQDAWR